MGNIVSGIIAALVFALLLLIVRPRIVVSDKLCKDPNERDVYRIKVVNKSLFRAINVSYSLVYFTEYGDGIIHIETIEPRKTMLTSISGIAGNYKDDYAIRISYKIDTELYPPDKGTFVFTILASHSFSDSVTCEREQYTEDKIVCGVFETKKSTKVIVSK